MRLFLICLQFLKKISRKTFGPHCICRCKQYQTQFMTSRQCLSDLNRISTFSTDFHEVPTIKFHENQSSIDNRADICRQTEGQA